MFEVSRDWAVAWRVHPNECLFPLACRWCCVLSFRINQIVLCVCEHRLASTDLCFFPRMRYLLSLSMLLSISSRTDWLYSQKYDRQNASIKRSIERSLVRSTSGNEHESAAWSHQKPVFSLVSECVSVFDMFELTCAITRCFIQFLVCQFFNPLRFSFLFISFRIYSQWQLVLSMTGNEISSCRNQIVWCIHERKHEKIKISILILRNQTVCDRLLISSRCAFGCFLSIYFEIYTYNYV